MGRAIDVLDLFLDGKGPRSVPEIIADLELPRSTAYELVQTLVARRLLRAVDATGHRFDLGLHLSELGSAYADGLNLIEQGQQVVPEVVARVGEAAHVASLDGVDGGYFVKAVPVRDATGRVVAGLSASVPAHQAGDRLRGEIAACVADAARSVSARLGFRPTAGGR